MADLRNEVADLRHQKAELERRLAGTNMSRNQTTQVPRPGDAGGPAYAHGESLYPADSRGNDTTVMPGHYGPPDAGDDQGLFAYDATADDEIGYVDADFGDQAFEEQPFEEDQFEDDPFEDPAPEGAASGDAGQATGGRTETLVSRGRRNATSPWQSRKRLIAAGSAAGLLLILILILVLSGNGASWPASVTTVQNEITKACQNGDVASEPGQVNFACDKSTRQVLWVFSLLTSYNNPHFNDLKTGRVGLEPITPSEGGEVAWSLNLHHPYYPDNPIDSLEVAARAINNIIGGATLTATGGSSVVQPGLESSPANCLRYTGSAKLRVRKGFPSVCARPITSAAGQANLVGDVYQKWIVGSGPRAAQNAALLFENYNNPGDPQVQLVLRQLAHSAS